MGFRTTNSPYAMAKLTAIELGRAMAIEYGTKFLILCQQICMAQNNFPITVTLFLGLCTECI